MCKKCDEIEKAVKGREPIGKTKKGTPNKFVLEYEKVFRDEFALALGRIATSISREAAKVVK